MKNYWLLQMLLLIMVMFSIKFCIHLMLKIHLVALIYFFVTAARAFANPFWKQMEPFFGFISDADISFLKKQVMDHLSISYILYEIKILLHRMMILMWHG